MTIIQVTTLGHPGEHANVYVKLHLCKDGTPINAEVESNIVSNIMNLLTLLISNVLLCSNFEYQEKINELLSESLNRVQSSDLTDSIAWAPNDVYAQVFANERNGRVQGVGFGPTPSIHLAKNTPTIAQVRSQERDAKVTQLKNQVAFLMEKVNRYENLEERVTQLMQLVQNQ